jgi:hypothetical protein
MLLKNIFAKKRKRNFSFFSQISAIYVGRKKVFKLVLKKNAIFFLRKIAKNGDYNTGP